MTRPALRPNRRRGDAGLTLIELTIAMAMFTIVSLGLYGVFARAAADRSLAVGRAEAYLNARSIMDRVETDLVGHMNTDGYTSEFRTFLAPSADALRSSSDARVLLDFTAVSALGYPSPDGLGWRPESLVGRGDQVRIVYRLSPDGRLFRLERRPPRPEELEPREHPGELVAEAVEIFEQRYFDGVEWHEEWDSAAAGATSNRAPRLIETRLVVLDNDGVPVELVSATELPTVLKETSILAR